MLERGQYSTGPRGTAALVVHGRMRAACRSFRLAPIQPSQVGRLQATPDKGGTSRTQSPQREESSDPQCYGTGMEVECTVPEYDRSAGSTAAAAADASTSTSSSTALSQAVDAALLISPFFFWGTSMVAMKTLGMPPMFMAAWRCLPAGGLLLLWASAKGEKGPSSAVGWLAVALFGLVDGACFQGFLAEGLQRTSAGLGSVIIDSQPLSVALASSILFGETLGLGGIVGLVLGVSGLVLLEGQSVGGGIIDTTAAAVTAATAATAVTAAAPDVHGALTVSGEAFMFLAAQSMATGTLMVRWVGKYCDPVAATGLHLIIGGLPLAALAASDPNIDLPDMLAHISATDTLLLLYVSLFGSAASYGVFFYLATVKGSLTRLSSLTFLTPMFAAAGGYFLLGETLTPIQLAGALVTLLGVTALNVSPGSDDAADGEAPKDGA